jgi:hypothetical protein
MKNYNETRTVSERGWIKYSLHGLTGEIRKGCPYGQIYIPSSITSFGKIGTLSYCPANHESLLTPPNAAQLRRYAEFLQGLVVIAKEQNVDISPLIAIAKEQNIEIR